MIHYLNQKTVVAGSLFLAGSFLVLAYFQRGNIGYCSDNYLQCETGLTFLMIFIPVAVLSLLVTFFASNNFEKWKMFTGYFILVYFFICLVSQSSPDFLRPSRGDMGVFLSLSYAVLSIVYLGYLLKNRPKV